MVSALGLRVSGGGENVATIIGVCMGMSGLL